MKKASVCLWIVLAGVLLWTLSFPGAVSATTLPGGFQESTAIGALDEATTFRFAPDGRVFVAEKSGLIKVFDDLTDTTPTQFADLRTNVHNFWDRGLLGLALDPNFPTEPYVYVLYVYDAEIGGTAPRWGTAGATSDGCPNPPGDTVDGCVVSGRVSRLRAAGNVMTGPEQVLIEDWCQQYPSHSGGGMAFGADGALYVSGGDGAAFNFTDYGQRGDPPNPCGDPPAGVGGTQSPPTTEGGRLRSQDLRTAGDPVGLNGSLIRVDPDTGAGLPGNPLFSSTDPNARRIVAYGLRNPFRLTIRSGTNDVWIGDVGEGLWEEIDRVPNPTDPVKNFGWPCYQGGADSGTGTPRSLRNPSFDSLNVNICENLYSEEPNGVTAPYFAYAHGSSVVSGESCPNAEAAVTGLAFSPQSGNPYPAAYRNALFFSDFARNCIWVMFAGADGLPDPSTRQTFAAGAPDAIDLQIGPGGELFYLDFSDNTGAIKRISYIGGANRAPTAVADATPRSGPSPLTVNFDGTGSTDPDPGDTLTYTWDFDGDGAFGDSTAPQPTHTYTQSGNHTARLRVTDESGVSDIASVVISVDNTAPTASIEAPLATTRWRVGDRIDFSGSATDPEDGTLPASALSWSLVLHHCPGNCHVHPIRDFPGTASGFFTAPDHDYPSHLELRLTASDSGGLEDTKSVRLDPRTVTLTFESSPTGLALVVGGDSGNAPFTREVIVGSTNSVSATSPQTVGGTRYGFSSWSDGKPQSHDIVAAATPATYTATFVADNLRPDAPSGLVARAASPTTVDLNWAAASDNVGVTGYRIYRDGALLTTLGAVTSFSDSSASAGTRYAYRVRALDAAGNVSGPSSPATATTPVTTTLSFPGGADARVEEANPSTNYGTSTNLRADGAGDPDVESYLRFRVEGLTGSLKSAKLRLRASSGTIDGPAVYKTGNAWTETGITWTSRPARTSGATDDKGTISSASWVEYDVSSLLNGNGTYSFIIATSSNDGVDFHSREATDVTHRPELVLTAESPACGDESASIVGTDGDDNLTGTAGDDVIVGLGGSDTISGLDGNDMLCGGDGADRILGGAGDDYLNGGAGNEVALEGEAGNDALDGDLGADPLAGGTGTDTATYGPRTAGVTADIDGVADDGNSDDGPAGARDNISPDVEKLAGGLGADTLTGSAANNTLTGGEGADVLSGLAGTDTASYATRTTGVTVDIDNVADDGNSSDGPAGARDDVRTSIERLVGGRGDDTLIGSAADNKLTGGLGADALIGFNGNDVLFANDGTADAQIDCDGRSGPGAADKAHVDGADPAPVGCETVGP